MQGHVQGMGGSSMGIWCAHGEGRAHFPDPQVKQAVLEGGLAPIRSLSTCHLLVLPFDFKIAKLPSLSRFDVSVHQRLLIFYNLLLEFLAQHCQV